MPGDVLRGRTVFISGPARGIGAETARQLSRRDANLALAGLEPELLEALAGELGPNAAWWEADVREPEQIRKAVTGAVERFGAIDVVVANAGVAPVGTVAAIDPADFERTVDINLLGVWRTVRAALPLVVARKGYVLCVASLAALIHLPLMAAYAAGKSGVHAFANALRLEVEASGTAVGTAYFGLIDTDMTRRALDDESVRPIHDRAGGMFRPKVLPVEVAGAAIVRGIERRSRSIVVPRYAFPALVAGPLFQRVAEAVARRIWRDAGAGGGR
jgi:NAD(P)-dependent dehydrogenase (short-subunit alcohol dehydrogenase family)